MRAQIIDTIDYIKEAEEVGFTRAQAEFQARTMTNVLNQLVTKEYLHNEFKLFENKIIIKLGVMMLGCVGLLTFLLRHA